MQHHKGNQSPYDYIISIANDKTSFYTRFAFLCSYNRHYPYWIGATLLFIEYTQLVAQTLMLDDEMYTNPDSEESFMYRIILTVVKLSNPIFFIGFDISFPVYITLFAIMLCYFLLKFALFTYMVIIAAKKARANEWLKNIWSWTYKIQGRVMYIVSTSFWVRTIRILNRDRPEFEVMNNAGVRAVCIIVITSEFLLSILLQAWVTYILPTRDFLARKDYKVEAITLVQKFGIQLMRTLVVANFPQNSLAVTWTCTTINTFLSCFRVRWCLVTLPYYKFNALFSLISLTISIACLSFAYSLKTFIKTVSPGDDVIDMGLNFPLVIWIILTAFSMKIALAWLKTILLRLITVKMHNVCPELLIHKPIIMKEIRELNQVPADPATQNTSWMYILNMAIASKIKTVLELINHENPESDENEEISDIKIITRRYLEGLLRKFPQNSLIALYAGNFYVKKLKLYGFGMKILSRLQKSSSYQASFNASLLIYELQMFLQSEYEKKKSLMDLSTYLKSLKVVAELRKKVCVQAEQQIKMYREMKVRSPDLNKLFQCGLEIDAVKKEVLQHIKTVFETTADLYVEPLMVCAQYYLTMNHWPDEYLKCMRTLQQKRLKLEKAERAAMLSVDNLYQRGNGMLLYSGLDGAEGKATYTKGVKELFGRDLFGNHLATLGMPCLHSYFHEFATGLLAQGNNDMLQLHDSFGFHSEGYIFPLSFYMNICPSLDQGLYYFCIIRMKPETKDFIMLNEQGEIEGVTKDIGIKLNLLNRKEGQMQMRKQVNISTISRELGRVNKAFNIIALPEKYKTTTCEDREDGASDDDLNGYTGIDLQSNNTYRDTTLKNRSQFMEKYSSFKSRTVNIDEAQKMMAIFTKGANVEINKLKEPKENTPIYSSADESLKYHCTVENQLIGAIFLKKITLEQVKSGKADSDKSNGEHIIVKEDWKSNASHQVNLNLDKTGCFKDDMASPSQADDFVSFMTDDEKELGWIDLRKVGQQDEQKDELEKSTIPPPSYQTPRIKALEDYQVTAGFDMPSTSRKLLLNKLTFPTLNVETPRKQEELKVIKISPGKGNKKKHDFKAKQSAAGGIIDDASSIQRSQSTELKVIKAFKDSESIDYYPRFYRGFFLTFYGVLITIFISQGVLKGRLESDVSNLQGKKNVLSTAETRNDLLITVHRRTRSLWNFATGRQNESLYSQSSNSAVILTLLDSDLQQLTAVNHQLVNSATSLEDENLAKLFQSDVRVYDVDTDDEDDTQETYASMTNFQATSRMIEVCLRAFLVADTDLNDSLLDFEMILRNAANDLLLQSENTADIFLSSLDTQRQRTIYNLNSNLVAILAPLSSVIIAFGVIIFSQYRNDKRNLSTFLKIDSNGVDTVLERIIQLKKLLQEDADFEQNPDINISDYYYNYNHHTDAPGAKAAKVQIQIPSAKSLTIKYYFYSLRLFVFVGIIIGLIMIYYSEMKKFTEDLNKTLTQLHYSDRMRSRINFAITTSIDLVSANGTSYIKNELTPLAFTEGIQDLNMIRNTIPNLFKRTDGSYDALIEDILFGNACAHVTGRFADACQTLAQNASNAGLVRFLSHIETALTDFDERFQDSSRTNEFLSNLTFEAFNQYVVPSNALSSLAVQISGAFNSYFERILNDGLNENNGLSYMIYFLLVVIYLLIYFSVVVKIREAENHFKRLLQLLPANLVLSNFVLKAYLLRTSEAAFESVRSEL